MVEKVKKCLTNRGVSVNILKRFGEAPKEQSGFEKS